MWCLENKKIIQKVSHVETTLKGNFFIFSSLPALLSCLARKEQIKGEIRFIAIGLFLNGNLITFPLKGVKV